MARKRLKVELHAHTNDDPHDHIPYSTRELIDHASTLGFDALAITLHNFQLDPSPWQAYARERGVVLIPGVERTIEGRHVLLLNYPASESGVATFAELRALRQRHRGLVVAPHPFFPSKSCLWGALDQHADLFDAVEMNAMFTRRIDFNARAARWAARRGIPVVGNGDVHRLLQMGTTFSLVDAEPDVDSICEAIIAGRVTVERRPLSLTRAASIIASLFCPACPRARVELHSEVPGA